MLTLITGFSGSGKTTLPKLFNGQLYWNYLIFSDPKRNLKLNMHPVTPLSIAKEIRREVMQDISFEKDLENNERYEYLKDTVVLGTNMTYRDILEMHAEMKIQVDPYHFIRNVFENQKNYPFSNIMITDWRYPKEYDFCQRGLRLEPRTIRIFRRNTKLSPHKSEKALDNYLTDFLLIPMKGFKQEFKEAVKMFPQYADYRVTKTTFD